MMVGQINALVGRMKRDLGEKVHHYEVQDARFRKFLSSDRNFLFGIIGILVPFFHLLATARETQIPLILPNS